MALIEQMIFINIIFNQILGNKCYFLEVEFHQALDMDIKELYFNNQCTFLEDTMVRIKMTCINLILLVIRGQPFSIKVILLQFYVNLPQYHIMDLCTFLVEVMDLIL